MLPTLSLVRVAVILIVTVAAVTGASASGPSFIAFTEDYCGTPPAKWLQPRSVVLPPHELPMTVQVDIATFAFDPFNVTINVGDTVMWTNLDAAIHTATSDTPLWDSGNLTQGQSFSFTFTSAGTFPYHCTRHTFMTGMVTVQGGASPTPTATATSTPTATATFTPTPTQTPSISGHLDYAVISKNVPNVAIAAAGSPPLNASTNSLGNYVLSGFGAGAYTVTPSRTAQPCVGTPNGIFANDAALISQHVVGIITLNADQQVAAKVQTLVPGISSLDASFVAQKTVSVCDPNNMAGQWRFTPPNVAHPSGVTGQLVENYRAYLLGDVSGDWDPLGAGAGADRSLPVFGLPAVASLPDMSASTGTSVTLPLRLDDLQFTEVNAYQFDLTYDPSVISPADTAATVSGTMSEGLNVVYNSPQPGLLRVSVYGAIPSAGDGVYLDLRFKVIGGEGASTPLTIENFRLGDGTSAIKTKSGQLSVSGPTP
jgi:hypothetical protein